MNKERNRPHGEEWEVCMFEDDEILLADLEKVMKDLLKASEQ